MVRKQQRPERAPGSCESETGQEDNCGSEKGGDNPMKWGRKRKVLQSMSSGTETEERKENVVSEIGDGIGEKEEKSEGQSGGKGEREGSLHLDCEREKDNGESGRGVKFDDNCEVMGEDSNGVSEEKIGVGEDSSSLRKRLRGVRKKVSYCEYAYDEDIEEAISGKRRKKRKGGQKGKKATAEEGMQENDTSKGENEGLNTKKKCGQESKKDEKVKESEVLESEGGEGVELEGDEGAIIKVRRRGRKKRENKANEESAGDLGCVEQVKDSSLRDDGCRYSLRTSRNQKEQHVLKDSKKKGTSTMCHQCQRNDKGRVVRCKKCSRKRFCIPCITNWYPKMSEDEIANACPVCLGNCNCKSCLRMEGIPVDELYKLKKDPHFSELEKVQHSKHLLRELLPYIRSLSGVQMKELEMEAKIQGSGFGECDWQC